MCCLYIYFYIYEGIFNYGRIKHHKSILIRGGSLGGFTVVILFGIFFFLRYRNNLFNSLFLELEKEILRLQTPQAVKIMRYVQH